MNKIPKSAYVHIPFCHRRCFYCDFSVVPIGDEVDSISGKNSQTINEYLYFLKREILSIQHKSSLSTIYIGGGTPSILNPLQITDLINTFKNHYGIDNGAEITMEVDPASFNQNDLYGFVNAGVNRFSLGAQSFNNIVLKNAGRRHTYDDVKQSCSWLYEAKNKNLIRSWSLDLIQNLPKSNFNIWKNDLENTFLYKPPHVSIYDLNIEEGTLFQKLKDLGKLNVPDEEQSFENSVLTSLMFKKSGYLRYEISNYSVPGHQSRHNRVYWKGSGWWSFGQGSTSSPWGIQFTRPRGSEEYKKWALTQENGKIEESLIQIPNKCLDLDEKIMLGLRLREGINIKELFYEHGWDTEKSKIYLFKLLQMWNKYIECGLLCQAGDRYFLSDPKGMELSNQILISMFRWWDQIN